MAPRRWLRLIVRLHGVASDNKCRSQKRNCGAHELENRDLTPGAHGPGILGVSPGMLIKALAPHVSSRTRAKGLHYFRSGAVIEMAGGEWTAHAVVRGTRDYRVELMRESGTDRFTASCECPYYADRAEICKHIWAALLEADQRGLLAGDGPLLPGATIEPEYRPGHATGAGAALLIPGAKPAEDARLAAVSHRAAAGRRRRRACAARAALLERRNRLRDQRARDPRGARHGDQRPLPSAAEKWRLDQTEAGEPHAARGGTPGRGERPRILSLLMGAGNPWSYGTTYEAGAPRSRYVLNGPLEDRVLPMIAQSGRGYLDQVGEEHGLFPFTADEGPPWRFDLEIATDEADDVIRVTGAFVRSGERLDLHAPALLLSRGFLFTRDRMARLEVDGSFAWIARLRAFGSVSIPRDQAAPLLETVARSGVDPAALPEELRYAVVDGTPRPRIRVGRPERQNPYALRQDLRATVQFDYSGVIVEGPPGAAAYDAANRRLVRRDRLAEQAAIDRLHQLGFRYTWSHFESRQLLGISPEQFPRVVHTLVNEGWRVEAEGRPFRSAAGMRLEVSSGIDWFDLHGAVDFGDGRSAPFPQLLAAVARGEDVVVLDDGSVGLLPEEWLRRYAAIAGFGTARGDAIRFERSQAALLDALLAAQPAIAYDEAFARCDQSCVASLAFRPQIRRRPSTARCASISARRSAGSSSCGGSVSAAAWPTTWASARPSWCWRCSTRGARRAAGGERAPSLVVVPRSLVFNWRDEAARFAPKLKVARLHRHPARPVGDRARDDLVLTTYGTLRRDVASLHAIRVRLRDSRRGAGDQERRDRVGEGGAAAQAAHRLALSGTPIENHLGELWSLFEFLNPGLLGSGDGIPARQLGARARRRVGAVAARARCDRSSCGAPKSRSRRSCREEPSRRFSASSSRRSGSTTTSCARTTARRCSARVARDGRQPVEDADPRGAAAAAPGRVPSAASSTRARATSPRPSSTC